MAEERAGAGQQNRRAPAAGEGLEAADAVPGRRRDLRGGLHRGEEEGPGDFHKQVRE